MNLLVVRFFDRSCFRLGLRLDCFIIAPALVVSVSEVSRKRRVRCERVLCSALFLVVQFDSAFDEFFIAATIHFDYLLAVVPYVTTVAPRLGLGWIR